MKDVPAPFPTVVCIVNHRYVRRLVVVEISMNMVHACVRGGLEEVILVK